LGSLAHEKCVQLPLALCNTTKHQAFRPRKSIHIHIHRPASIISYRKALNLLLRNGKENMETDLRNKEGYSPEEKYINIPLP